MNTAEATREAFEPYLNAVFTASAEGLSFAAELIEVSPVGETVGPTGRHPFAIVLRGPGVADPVQQTYRLEADGLEPFDLFLVPIGPDDAGMKYEAVFT